MKGRGGIYKIVSPSGKFYIGSSKDLAMRKRKHLNDLRGGRHGNINLQRAYQKYGEALKFDVVMFCEEHDLIANEQRFIDDLNPAYNIMRIADRRTGVKLSAAHRAALRNSVVGVPKSKEHREKLRASKLGKRRPDWVCKKISAAKKGVSLKLSDEQRVNRSEAAKLLWKKQERNGNESS